MSEPIREQISAFLDGELPASETELLLKRLARDPELRECFGRYALIGEAARGASHAHFAKSFPARVNGAIDGAPEVAVPPPARVAVAPRWWRPMAGAAVAAGVAVVAIVALQQRAVTPALTGVTVAANRAAASAVAAPAAASRSEAISYTVPTTFSEAPAALPEARLTNYVFAHSRYSSLLGQRDVLSGLIAGGDASGGTPVAEPLPGAEGPMLQGNPPSETRIVP
jgi:sigma-E factor negative regulatory protein RseA